MGNRMLKESIRTSRTVNSMSHFQFRVWVYLITYVDDFGCGSADPELLKGLVFPRMKDLNEKSIQDALDSLASKGCIRLYEVDGEPYFCFPNWSDHQRVQAKKRKYPAPTDAHGNSRKVTVTHGDFPPETKPNTNQGEVAPAREDDGDEDDILSAVAAHQRADDLIRRYKLPDGDTSREALLEDAEKHGFDRLEEALKRASLRNSRQMLSVVYYRKFLEEPAQKGGTQDGWDACPTF